MVAHTRSTMLILQLMHHNQVSFSVFVADLDSDVTVAAGCACCKGAVRLELHAVFLFQPIS